MTEAWDVYDMRGNKLNKIVLRDTGSLLKDEYHLSVDVWIINSKNQFLIQKRSANKKLSPNLWICSAGGAVIAGEDSFQGCIREAQEELGITPNMNNAKMVHTFIRNTNAIMKVWLVKQDVDMEDIHMQKEEVSDVKWATFEEIEQMVIDKTFVPTVIEGLNACMKELEIA